MDTRGRERADTALPAEFHGRWTAARKEALVLAVEGGELSLNDALRRYYLTLEEYNAWRRAFRKKGRAGLQASKVAPPKQRHLPGFGR